MPFHCCPVGHAMGLGVGVGRRAASTRGSASVPLTATAPPSPSNPFSTARRFVPRASDLTRESNR